ncbi:MAG: alpha/beta fold hydrolase [Solirubrobacteraceae bacterium]
MPTLVCLHGLARSASDFNGVRPGLLRYGRVVAPDLPRGGMPALRSATADLPHPAILIAHSMAGPLALWRAAQDPERVAGVVLTDSFFPPARNGRTLGASVADYARHRAAVVRAAATRGARPRLGGGTARGTASLARLGLHPAGFHALAASARAPVLVVHARDDHYVPIDFALAAAHRHPAWSVARLRDGGHNAHVERPAEWLDAVTPWLDALARH